jgi:hypothetical protein
VRSQKLWIRRGMSPGGAKTGSFVSTTARSGGASAAMATSSPKLQSRPSSAHVRRHSWSSQRPATLRSSRYVPATPPSFVRFDSNVRSSTSGSTSSTPTSDHVPALM